MTPRRLKIFFHDACFDGTASAALFARFYRDEIAPAAIALAPMHHSERDPFEGVPLDGDDHACVDFRFCADPAMTWWFDHHKTAFQPPTLRTLFDARAADARWFFDPLAASCAGLVARVARERWGWAPTAALAELVRWAEVIDAARFASAADATALDEPAQQIALWLGSASADDIARYVDALAIGGLDLAAIAGTIAKDGIAAARVTRVLQRDALARAGRWHGDVVAFDLADDGASAPGFLGYELYPACRYTVALTRTPRAVKIAVGWNPWGAPRTHDVGSLCEHFGGGGHASVGGITLAADELVRGRRTVDEIVEALGT